MAGADIKAGRAYVELSIRSKVNQGLRVAEKQLKNFGTSVASSAGVVAAGIGGALSWPIKLAADLEQTTVAFEVLTGSADGAAKMVSDIQAMAAVTPFDSETLLDQGKQLMNFGIAADQVLPTMKALGDASGGNKERFDRLGLAYGQVISKGKLMGQEANQMREQGFDPLSEIAKITGKSMAQLNTDMEAGAISAGMVTQAFAAATGTGGKYSGMMEKQSQTLTGLWSTLMDNAKLAMATFGTALLPTLKTFAQVGITALEFVKNFVTNNQALIATIARVALIVGVVAAGFVAVGGAAMALSFVVGLVASAFSAVFAIIGLIFSPLGLLIGLLVAAGVAAYAYRDVLIEAFTGLLTWLQPFIDQIKQYFSSISQAILAGQWWLAAQIAMTKVQIAIQSAWAPIASFWSDAVFGFSFIWDRVVWGLATTFRAVTYAIAQSMVWLVSKIAEAINYMGKLAGLKANLLDEIDSKGINAELSKMQKADQVSGDKALADKDQARFAAANARRQSQLDEARRLSDVLKSLEAESAKKFEEAGSPTVMSRLKEAKEALTNALGLANQEAGKTADVGKLIPKFDASGAAAQKTVAQGTFTAAAAALFGGSDNAGQTTAKNTSALVKLAQDNARKKGPAFT